MRETDACPSPRDCSIDRRYLGRTRGARYQIADIHGGQASSEVAHSHGTIAGPRPKRRPPGFRRDLRGLSHSADPHTTIYTWTLLSRSTLVAQRSTLCYHARGLQLRTRQSSEPWSEFEHKRSPRNNASEARYPGLRGGSMDDGSRDECTGRGTYTLLARD